MCHVQVVYFNYCNIIVEHSCSTDEPNFAPVQRKIELVGWQFLADTGKQDGWNGQKFISEFEKRIVFAILVSDFFFLWFTGLCTDNSSINIGMYLPWQQSSS